MQSVSLSQARGRQSPSARRSRLCFGARLPFFMISPATSARAALDRSEVPSFKHLDRETPVRDRHTMRREYSLPVVGPLHGSKKQLQMEPVWPHHPADGSFRSSGQGRNRQKCGRQLAG
jgi:hypothetical protein